MEKLKQFWSANKVFILGCLYAAFMGVQEFFLQSVIDWKAVGLGFAVAGLSYMAKNWRGQAASMVGVIANSIISFATLQGDAQMTVSQLIGQIGMAVAFFFLSDPKSRGYENSTIIKAAKVDGEMITPAVGTNAEIKKIAEAEIKYNAQPQDS